MSIFRSNCISLVVHHVTPAELRKINNVYPENKPTHTNHHSRKIRTSFCSQTSSLCSRHPIASQFYLNSPISLQPCITCTSYHHMPY
ncbi:hypothetical protein OXX59_000820 [Metschnikowia pulcherrima]